MSGSDGYGIDIGLTKADTCCKNTGIIHNKHNTKNGVTLTSINKTTINFLLSCEGQYHMTLYSLSGKIVSKEIALSNNYKVKFNNPKIAQGNYLLKVKGLTNTINDIRIINISY